MNTFSDTSCEQLYKTMFAICKDNSYTWRSSLTIGKAYEVVKQYTDEYTGEPGIEIICDDGVLRPYRAERFTLKTQEASR